MKYELEVRILFGIELTDGIHAAAISCCTKAVLEALVVLFPVVSVTTVIFPHANRLATLSAVAAVAVTDPDANAKAAADDPGGTGNRPYRCWGSGNTTASPPSCRRHLRARGGTAL